MWKFVKDFWVACLFIIGLREKKVPVLPAASISVGHRELEVTLESPVPLGFVEMQRSLIKARQEIIKPLSDVELDKVVNNFLSVSLPAEYKKYLSNPIANIGGDWIIITPYSFKSDTGILRQALPVIVCKLKQQNIRAEDRAKNGYIWINAIDITNAIEFWEKSASTPTLYRQLNSNGTYKSRSM